MALTDTGVQGEGVVEVGPWGMQGLSGGVEKLGLAEPGLGTQKDVSRVGHKDCGLAALCLRSKDGRLRGTGLGVSRVLRAVSCYSCCIIELLASLHSHHHPPSPNTHHQQLEALEHPN